MTGTAMERRKEQTPTEQRGIQPEGETPTVIDVESYPVTQQRPTRTAILIDRGLALLSSLARLALLWVENREGETQRLTPKRPAATSPAPTTSRRTTTRPGRGGQRQRRRHRRGER